MSDSDYVLITAARNEAATIGQTIESVVMQTLLPRKWVIVSDASADETDEIVKSHAAKHAFITFLRFLRKDDKNTRDFGAKVCAVRAGYEQLGDTSYAFIGNLDADVTFEPDYFQRLLAKFTENPRLGVGGGLTFDVYNGEIHERYASLDSIGGAVQMFRRECYEQVGGYRPFRLGSEDAVALHMARWKGWETRAFPDLPVMHHRRTGTAEQSVWRARFNQGATYYAIGWSPAFVSLRALYRLPEKPYVLATLVRTAGFLWAAIRGEKYPLEPELIRFIRKEHRQKLLDGVRGRWHPKKTG